MPETVSQSSTLGRHVTLQREFVEQRPLVALPFPKASFWAWLPE